MAMISGEAPIRRSRWGGSGYRARAIYFRVGVVTPFDPHRLRPSRQLENDNSLLGLLRLPIFRSFHQRSRRQSVSSDLPGRGWFALRSSHTADDLAHFFQGQDLGG